MFALKLQEEEKANTIVNACWKLVEDQCKDNTLNEINKPSENDVGGLWKIVRVFVSSTFSDMFCEREVLVKKVSDFNPKRIIYFEYCNSY